MNIKNLKVFSFVMAVIFLLVGVIQYLEGNSNVAIFPIICSFVFLYKGFSQHK